MVDIKRFSMFLFIILILSPSASAAKIYGTVYDLSLNPVENAVVEINTVPNQKMIAQDGGYSFDVVKGNYTIKVSQYREGKLLGSAEEKLVIEGDGSYILDLVIFPEISDGLNNDINSSGFDIDVGKSNYLLIVTLFAIMVTFFVFVYMKYFYEKKTETSQKALASKHHKKESELDEDLNNLLEFIKKQDGRATQKEIRKELAFSEAKVSLMITELEDKGIIKKIKKGRGNIIILNKH